MRPELALPYGVGPAMTATEVQRWLNEWCATVARLEPNILDCIDLDAIERTLEEQKCLS
jgi:hypothetical protein